MDIQKEKNSYLAELLEREVIKKDEFDDIVFKTEINAFHSCYLSARFMDNINFGWSAWLAAKSQEVPEGFVLLEKKNLRDTYYLVDSEYVVDDPTEYELELECGEIATLEKWQRTKEIKVFCANIYSDEDNFEVVEFESIEDAEKAIAENKAMIEAQEQSNG